MECVLGRCAHFNVKLLNFQFPPPQMINDRPLNALQYMYKAMLFPLN